MSALLSEAQIMRYKSHMFFAVFMAILMSSTTMAIVASAADSNDKDFIPLFDGKSLNGWEGKLDVFRIEQGAIVGGNLKDKLTQNEFLCTTKEYGNFELRLKVKLVGDTANGGIQIRSKGVPNNNEVSGYQADMAAGYWGKIYDESRRNRCLTKLSIEQENKIVKHNDWNEYIIRCEGPRIQLWLNGQQTADYTESDSDIPLKGIIGLQIHGGPPSEAWYKDITIRELK
jgi:hypothetical protein